MGITVIGLGPGDKKLLTLESFDLLNQYRKEGKKIFFRTKIHPAAQDLIDEGFEIESFDDLYDTEETFETVYQKIVERLIEESKVDDILYAVPGHPNIIERTVTELRELAEKNNIPIDIKNSLSFISPLALSVGKDIGQGVEIIDSYDLVAGLRLHHDHPIIVTQIFDDFSLSNTKLKLMETLPDETEVYLIKNAGLNDEEVIKVPLYELDHHKANHLTSLYIPEQDLLNDFEKIVEVTKTLRMPGGCPWDREQTHESLKRYVLEEAAEVVDAIENGDIDNLQEELGDLMFQVLIHAQIADEENYFTIYDVIESLTEKMIRRHPHVFADAKADTSDEVFINWDKIKATEKSPETLAQNMRGIPKSLSALLVADKIQNKARKVGFDWDDSKQAFDKVLEEVDEVKEELYKEPIDANHLKEELGDLLFATVNVIRLLDYEPEEILRQANNKFIDRFEKMEESAKQSGQSLEDLNLDEMETLWQKVK